MSENLATADPAETENQPEEFSDAIAEAQARFDQQEVETLQRKFGVDPKPAPDAKASSGRTQGNKGDHGNGVDRIVDEVETTLGKDKARAVRKIHSDYTKASNRASAAERALAQMTERIAKLESAMQPAKEEPPDPLLSRVTPQQWELFDRMAAQRGYVRRDDLEAAQQHETAVDYNTRSVQEAQERFGDNFGVFDDNGQLLLSDEAFEAIQKESDRVFNPTYGITAKDLYILANWERLLDEARGGGGRAQEAEALEDLPPLPPPKPRRTFTERNSAPQTGGESVYTRGKDSLEEVVRRSAIRNLRRV